MYFQHVENCRFLSCERKLKIIVQLSKIFIIVIHYVYNFVLLLVFKSTKYT